MGWNSGYTIFESTVIGAYNLGKLDKALLTVLMEPYRNSDIDSGGSQDLLSDDGKNVEEIVIETWGLDVPVKPDEDIGEYGDNSEVWDEYYDQVYEQMSIVTNYFGWA